MKQVFQSQHRPLTFNTIRELVRYYRSGDFKHLKLTTQLSPVPKGLLKFYMQGILVCIGQSLEVFDSVFKVLLVATIDTLTADAEQW